MIWTNERLAISLPADSLSQSGHTDIEAGVLQLDISDLQPTVTVVVSSSSGQWRTLSHLKYFRSNEKIFSHRNIICYVDKVRAQTPSAVKTCCTPTPPTNNPLAFLDSLQTRSENISQLLLEIFQTKNISAHPLESDEGPGPGLDWDCPAEELDSLARHDGAGGGQDGQLQWSSSGH